ncbi:MAG TPA: hypothetical protein EYH50_03860 [Pyrodictium delaneyi]|uniref:ATPase dynein-related AAA domain-containing protein n=1 Tax=Pyrodictium delaneyi TaxID=1273541 RepID=A0A833E8V0_9CREN|nr:hypothetical protein [Pyrodictium delaneyi]
MVVVIGNVARVAVELLLLSGKSVLLAGAPGTGKTRLGFETARGFTGIDPLVVVGRGDMAARELLYSYEPLDSGFRVVLGGLAVSVLASWARLMAGLAPRWLLLDELNRMNAETVLGSLFTALDLAHRLRVEVVPRWLVEKVLRDGGLLGEVADAAGLEKSQMREMLAVVLRRALDGAERVPGLPLPYSWRAIATMNMVDRSHLFRLGFALLRRFPLVLVPGIGEEVAPSLDHSVLEDVERSVTSQERAVKIYRSIFEAMQGELCRRAIEELATDSSLTPFDKPIYAVGLDGGMVEEALEVFEGAVKTAAVFAARLGSLGVEVGPALLADVCRVVAVARLRGGVSEDVVADIAVASLLLPQLGAIAPAVKSELLFGGEARRARSVRRVLALAPRLLGEKSMSARYAEALSLELPVQHV